ncbi:stringent starvation protein SspA [Candidatus Williamhamiltonella defendens]|uniref:stringent starvation protein SspA n=1 Tax=Candidatus Williamhamiltonella defendens TaxID=138072 RepID=UPI00130DA285|nr:stringent starvation protein SspA [Candidatus Hamiltonella defensa]
MSVAANKCSVITLFSGSTDIFSHQVRIVLAEKGVKVVIKYVQENEPLPKDFIALNPCASLPTLVDRDLILYRSSIIMEYLDERFPHPPLMPVYPMIRGHARLMMHRIENDWYSLFDKIQKGPASEVASVRQQLKEELLALAPMFQQKPYFMSDTFSLIDCYLAPLLWRLPELNIKSEELVTGVKELKNYMTRIFDRDPFLTALTEAESQMNLFHQETDFNTLTKAVNSRRSEYCHQNLYRSHKDKE